MDLNVVYIEDEPVTRRELGNILRRKFSQVYEAESGEDGLRLWREYRADIVIVDIALPGMNGIEVTKRIRETDSATQIIITTAYGDPEYFIDAIETGINHFVLKPVDLDKLDAALEKSIVSVGSHRQFREQQDRIRTLSAALEQSPSVAVITDIDGKIEYVNPKFTELTGYAFAEAVGHNPRVIQSGKTPLEVYQALWNTIKAGGAWHGEFLNRKKNGDLYWESASISSIRDSEGRIIKFMKVAEDMTRIKKLEENLRQEKERAEAMLLVDALTGLYSRRGFFALAEQHLRLADRMKRKAYLFFGDVDDFKNINDTLGHTEGDRALQEMAGILRDSFRKSDIIARIGGDEFAVLAIDSTGAGPEAMCARLKRSLDAQKGPARPFRLFLSLGVCCYDPASPLGLDDLLAQADRLMYEQKRRTKDSFEGFL